MIFYFYINIIYTSRTDNMSSLSNLHFATLLAKIPVFSKIPGTKITNFIDFVSEFLFLLRDIEKEGNIKDICTEIYSETKLHGEKTTDDVKGLYSVVKEVIKSSKVEMSHIVVTEAMVPFLKELSKYYGHDFSGNECFFENEGDHYLIELGKKATIRYDNDGELFKKVEETPVGSNSIDRCVTPELVREMSDLLRSPSPFVPIEPDEKDLKILGKKNADFPSLGKGVSKCPESPPVSYSDIVGSKTPGSITSPMESIFEEPEPETDLEMIEGKIYIFHSKKGTGAFINHLKINGKKITREVDKKKVIIDSIFLSRFKELDHVNGKIGRIPRELVSYNRNNESQFYPMPGFMENLQVKTDTEEWKDVFSV